MTLHYQLNQIKSKYGREQLAEWVRDAALRYMDNKVECGHGYPQTRDFAYFLSDELQKKLDEDKKQMKFRFPDANCRVV